MPWMNPTEQTVDGAKVRVSESTDRNRHGAMRYMVQVLNERGDVAHTDFCEQSRWLGHCGGQLYLPQVVAWSRKQCALDDCKAPALCNDFSECDARLMANEIGTLKTSNRT